MLRKRDVNIFVRATLLLVIAVLGCLVRIDGRGIYRAFVYANGNAFGNFYDEISLSYIFDFTKDTTGGNDIATGLKAVSKFLISF